MKQTTLKLTADDIIELYKLYLSDSIYESHVKLVKDISKEGKAELIVSVIR